ncbi:MAG TPA: GNAT family protein [Xanthobacteraceae bacterium]|nr:GNAT family protein [Xanthobacteraceae bacterium]
MSGRSQPKLPKKTVRIDAGDYYMRTVTAADASDRWAAWMADPEAVAMLNAPAQTLTKVQVADYIKSFDQRAHMLIGIFATAGDTLLGFLRVDIDPALGRFLVSMLIGEPEYRNKGVTNAITVPFRDYFFETLGLKVMLATALSHNKAIIHYLIRSGWHLDRTIPRHVKSHGDGAMLDLCFFSQTREAWRAWKQANLPAGAQPPPP